MPIYMRNTTTGRTYVYDPNVFKRRRRVLEIVHGSFVDGEFVPEKAPLVEPMGLPEEEEPKTPELSQEIEEVPPAAPGEEAVPLDTSIMVDKINKLRSKADIQNFAMKQMGIVVDMSKTKPELKEQLLALVKANAQQGNIF